MKPQRKKLWRHRFLQRQWLRNENSDLIFRRIHERSKASHAYICATEECPIPLRSRRLQTLRRPTGDSFVGFPFLDYLTGLAKLSRLDSDADSYFKKFIAGYKGENHIKSAYQKIAWCYLLKQDSVNYYHFINKAEHAGGSTLDADKQAKKEADSKRMPDKKLLEARLLFDGGYYEKASADMTRLNESNFDNQEDKTEYLYRLGRIYGELGKTDLALLYYDKTIAAGKNLTRYFAANAAFESGRIYEQKGNKEKAIYYYNLCISFPNHEYKNGLDQKAKAGLNRLG